MPRLKWQAHVAAAIVAATMVTACGVIPGAGGSGDGTPSGPVTPGAGTAQASARWQAQNAQQEVLGTWIYRKSLVVAANTQVTAYNLDTGTVLWHTKAPVVQGLNTMFCGASPSASGPTAVLGIGAIPGNSSGDISDCHSIVSLNLAKGQLGWLQGLPSQAEQVTEAQAVEGHPSFLQKGIVVAVSGNTVVAGWHGVLAGFTLANGARQWTTVLGKDPSSDFNNFNTTDIAISGASAYVVTSEIFPEGVRLQRLDTATGKITRTVPVSTAMTGLSKPNDGTILSAAPLDIEVEQIEPDQAGSIVFLNQDLAPRLTVKTQQKLAAGNLFTASLGGNQDARSAPLPLAMGDGLLVGSTIPPRNDELSELEAVSTTTGVVKWTTPVPDADFYYPVTVTSSVIQAVGISQGGQGNPELITVATDTGKVLSEGRPRSFGQLTLGQDNAYYHFVEAGGHVYGVDWGQIQPGPRSDPAVFSMS